MTHLRTQQLELIGRERAGALRSARLAYLETRQRLPAGQPLAAQALAECVASGLAVIDTLVAAARPDVVRMTGRDIACRAGCSFCCHTMVFPSVSEAALIAYGLLGGPDAAAAHASFRAQGAAVAGLASKVRQQRRIPCGALEGDRCGVYELRPGICRAYVSLSLLACQKDWKERFQPKPKARVPTVGQFQLLAEMVVLGMDLWLLQRGLEVARVELGAGVARMLEPGVLVAWLAGERVLDGVATRQDPESYASMLRAMESEMGDLGHG